MCVRFYSAVCCLLLLAMLALGTAPVPSAASAVPGPPPCCAHGEAEPESAPACPTVECPHCGLLSAELAEPLTCGAILNEQLQRFAEPGNAPPETFPVPLEYPPRA